MVRQKVPEFFYRSIKEDLCLEKLIDILTFTEA